MQVIMLREMAVNNIQISHCYLITQSVELGLVKPRLRGAELAGSARVHLDPDLVALLRDVADAVKLVRANLMSLTELSVGECVLNICLLEPCLAHICKTFVVSVFCRQRQVDVRVVKSIHRHLRGWCDVPC